ncbi:MAG: PilZ domain-containing protein [Oligoflexia bacterium]|nr:PilZ domain-containing protein [Oligoflexia bacterium]
MKSKIQTEQIIKDHEQIIQELLLKKQKGSNIIVWQKDESGKRFILGAINLQLVDQQNNFIEVASTTESEVDFNNFIKDLCIYIHHSEDHLIYKSVILEQENKLLRIQIPESMMTYTEENIKKSEEKTEEKIEEDTVVVKGGEKDNSENKDLENVLVTGEVNENASDNDLFIIKGEANNSDNVRYQVSSKDNGHINDDEDKAVFRVSDGVKSGNKFSSSTELLKISSATLSKEEREEQYYKEKRGSTRKQIKGDKHARIFKKNDENSVPEYYQLLDLSQGGIAFVCEDKNEFKPGAIIVIDEITGSSISNAVEGEVRSVRTRDEETGYKVGVRFLAKEPS